MSGYQWTEQDVERQKQKVARRIPPVSVEAVLPKANKYHNVKTVAEGITFDSKREAAYYIQLRMRERAGEINNLQTQVEYPLTCPASDGTAPIVAHYVADFVYFEKGTGLHVVDAKGVKTAIYKLKRRWLYLQSGITIEEV